MKVKVELLLFRYTDLSTAKNASKNKFDAHTFIGGKSLGWFMA
jgi:hypothetical protein